eukprot:1160336-Pelagomonas_calceolata.AAC.4
MLSSGCPARITARGQGFLRGLLQEGKDQACTIQQTKTACIWKVRIAAGRQASSMHSPANQDCTRAEGIKGNARQA